MPIQTNCVPSACLFYAQDINLSMLRPLCDTSSVTLMQACKLMTRQNHLLTQLSAQPERPYRTIATRAATFKLMRATLSTKRSISQSFGSFNLHSLFLLFLLLPQPSEKRKIAPSSKGPIIVIYILTPMLKHVTSQLKSCISTPILQACNILASKSQKSIPNEDSVFHNLLRLFNIYIWDLSTCAAPEGQVEPFCPEFLLMSCSINMAAQQYLPTVINCPHKHYSTSTSTPRA